MASDPVREAIEFDCQRCGEETLVPYLDLSEEEYPVSARCERCRVTFRYTFMLHHEVPDAE